MGYLRQCINGNLLAHNDLEIFQYDCIVQLGESRDLLLQLIVEYDIDTRGGQQLYIQEREIEMLKIKSCFPIKIIGSLLTK